MDRQRLRYFLAVAEQGNFNRAAERLHLAQSSLSRHVQSLEEDLGVKLFERLPVGVRLTSAGIAFREEAVQILEAYDHAHLRVQRAAAGSVGSLKIGLSDLALRDPVLQRQISGFADMAADVDLDFTFAYSQEQIELLHRSQIDIGFLFNAPSFPSLFDRRDMSEDTYDLLVPSGHRLASANRVSMQDLQGERFIVGSRSRSYIYYWDSIFGRLLAGGIVPIIAHEAPSESAQIGLVSAGLGISFIHGSIRDRTIPGVVLRQVVDMPIRVKLTAMWRKDNGSQALARFRDSIRTTA